MIPEEINPPPPPPPPDPSVVYPYYFCFFFQTNFELLTSNFRRKFSYIPKILIPSNKMKKGFINCDLFSQS